MTASKSLAWIGPLAGAGVGTALAAIGLAFSHLAFYFAMPLAILGLRALEKAGVPLHLDFRASLVLLAVVTPVLFAAYGAAVVIPSGRAAKVRVVGIILAANLAACALLAL
jgi:hypothetical protein